MLKKGPSTLESSERAHSILIGSEKAHPHLIGSKWAHPHIIGSEGVDLSPTLLIPDRLRQG